MQSITIDTCYSHLWAREALFYFLPHSQTVLRRTQSSALVLPRALRPVHCHEELPPLFGASEIPPTILNDQMPEYACQSLTACIRRVLNDSGRIYYNRALKKPHLKSAACELPRPPIATLPFERYVRTIRDSLRSRRSVSRYDGAR